jgi:hypothetical protein
MAMSSGRRSERSGMAYDHVRKLLPLKSGRVGITSSRIHRNSPPPRERTALLDIENCHTTLATPVSCLHICPAWQLGCIATTTVYALFTFQ